MNTEVYNRGFTLLELLIILTVMAIFASEALPVAEVNVVREKENDLKYYLQQIRAGIVEYESVEGTRPTSFLKMVDAHNLRRIYEEPWGATWEYRASSAPLAEWKELTGSSKEVDPGDTMVEVRTSSTKEGLDGIQYTEY